MSVDQPPGGDVGPTVEIAEDDHQQTLLAVSLPGVEAVIAVDHGADLRTVHEAFREASKEVKHTAQVVGRDAEFDGGDER